MDEQLFSTPKDAMGPLNDAFKFFIAHMPFNVTEEALKEHFRQFGEVNFVKIIYDKEKKKSRGYGFLYMLTADGNTAVESYATSNNNRILFMNKPDVFLARDDENRKMPTRNPLRAKSSSAQPKAYDSAPRQTTYMAAQPPTQQHAPTGGYVANAPQPVAYARQTHVSSQTTYTPFPYSAQQPTTSYVGPNYAPVAYQANNATNSSFGLPSIPGQPMNTPVTMHPASSFPVLTAQTQAAVLPGPPQQPVHVSNSYQPVLQPSLIPAAPHGSQHFQQPANQPPPPPPRAGTKVFLENLPTNTKPQDIVSSLSEHHVTVKICTIEYDKDPNATWCYAHIDLSTPAEASRILDMAAKSTLQFKGRILQASVDTPRTFQSRSSVAAPPSRRSQGSFRGKARGPRPVSSRHIHAKDPRRSASDPRSSSHVRGGKTPSGGRGRDTRMNRPY